MLLAQMAPRLMQASLAEPHTKKTTDLALTLGPIPIPEDRGKTWISPLLFKKLETAPAPTAPRERGGTREDVPPSAGSSVRDVPSGIAPLPYEEHFVDPTGVDQQHPSPRAHDPRPTVTTQEGTKRAKALNTLAVIIDDLGYNGAVSHAMMALPADLTLAILPGGDHSRTLAQLGQAAGREILLHQPMEPQDYPRISPGPGALFVTMDTATIQRVLRRNLERFPEAVGVNNHMGSRFTSDPHAMDAVMTVLRERHLFFIDSRTAESTVGMKRAVAGRVPTASRDVFIDNTPEVDAILHQLAILERRAGREGGAIGIGHPYPETLAALRIWLPTLPKHGIQLVRVSRFLCPAASRASYPARNPRARAYPCETRKRERRLHKGGMPSHGPSRGGRSDKTGHDAGAFDRGIEVSTPPTMDFGE